MVFVRLARFPGADAGHFEALAQLMGHPPARGRLAFAAGPVDDGWQVVQVWEERRLLEEFNTAHLLPAQLSPSWQGFPAPPVVVDFETESWAAAPVMRNANLRGARFVECDLSGVVMRGVEVSGLDIDAPWLPHGDPVRVNGVDVVGHVETELDRRFPGRDERRAQTPAGLRSAWAAVESAWSAALVRAGAMPPGSVEESVAGEWTFTQTLRHLVMATDLWVGQAVLGLEHPFHPLGLAWEGAEAEGFDLSGFATHEPSYDEVLAARAGRVALVRDLLARVTPDELTVARTNPWAPEHTETTLSCLHVVLEEEWEHLRFALRDLDAIETSRG